jgi:hypothetical protein
MRERDHLEAERQHIREQPGLDDLRRIDAIILEMREALVEKARSGAEDLQIVGNGGVVE